MDQFYRRNDRPCGVQPKCKECVRAYQRAHLDQNAAAMRRFRQRNPDASAEYMRKRREDPEFSRLEREKYKEYYARTAEQQRQKSKRWKEANPERNRQNRSEWWANNPGARNASRMKRYVVLKQAMPSWANQKYIALWYRHAAEESERTGMKCHVDHIVPLQSELVCGLNVEHNLQVLFSNDNRSKGNYRWPDMPLSHLTGA